MCFAAAKYTVITFLLSAIAFSCDQKKQKPSPEDLKEGHLKKNPVGEIKPKKPMNFFGSLESNEPYADLFHPGNLLSVSIEMPQNDWESLRFQEPENPCGPDISDNNHGYTYFKANLKIQNQTMPEVAIRKRNHCGSKSSDKPGLAIKFDKYIKKTEFKNSTSLTLNNSWQDPSLIRQCFTYFILQELGFPYPLCNFVRVSVNAKYYGIYINLEPVKNDYLSRNFGTKDLPVYEGGSTGADFTPEGIGRIEYKNELSKKQTLENLLDRIKEQEIEEIFDIDALIQVFALESLIGHWDGYSSTQNNFYMTKNPANSKYTLLIYGVDQTFQLNHPQLDPESGYPIERKSLLFKSILANPDYRSRLKFLLMDYAEKLSQSKYLEYLIEAEEFLRPHVEEQNVKAFTNSVKELREAFNRAANLSQRKKAIERLFP